MTETQDAHRVTTRPTARRKEMLETRCDRPLGADTAELLAAMPQPGEIIDRSILDEQFSQSRRRRMDDVMNVLCGLGMAVRVGTKRLYQWYGPGGFVKMVIQLRKWGYRNNGDTPLDRALQKREKEGFWKMAVLEKAAYSTAVALDLSYLCREPYMMNNGTEWEGANCTKVVLGAMDLCMPGHDKTSRIGYDVMNVMEAAGLIKQAERTAGKRGKFTLLMTPYFAANLGAYIHLESLLTGCDPRSIEIIACASDGSEENRFLVQSESTASEPLRTVAEAKKIIDSRRAAKEKRAAQRKRRMRRRKRRQEAAARRKMGEQEEDYDDEVDSEALTLSSTPKRIKVDTVVVSGTDLFPELADIAVMPDPFGEDSLITFIPYDLGADAEMVK